MQKSQEGEALFKFRSRENFWEISFSFAATVGRRRTKFLDVQCSLMIPCRTHVWYCAEFK